MVQELQQHVQPGLSSYFDPGMIANTQLSFCTKPDKHAKVAGVRQKQTRAIVRDASNNITIYTAIEWLDEATGDVRYSCNCQGWAIFKKGNPDRWCQHTLELAMNPTLNEMGQQPAVPRTTPETTDTPPGIRIDGHRQRNFL